jgi:hypothetical protein
VELKAIKTEAEGEEKDGNKLIKVKNCVFKFKKGDHKED